MNPAYIQTVNLAMNNPTARTEQPRNPLHGVTLEAIVRALEARIWSSLIH
jgi:uncharacterized protein (DUF2132 family)